jgi:hypothetical protein
MMFRICLACLFIVGEREAFAQTQSQFETRHHGQSFLEYCVETRLGNLQASSKFQSYGTQRRKSVSVGKIATELVVGSLAGFVAGGLMYEISKPKKKEENFIGTFWSATLVGSAAMFGTSAGVYLIGTNDDEGSYWKTVIGASLGAVLFSAGAKAVATDPDTRIWIIGIGLPIGATVGFNVTRGETYN